MPPPVLTCTQGEFGFDGHVPAEIRVWPFLLLFGIERERDRPGSGGQGDGVGDPTSCSGTGHGADRPPGPRKVAAEAQGGGRSSHLIRVSSPPGCKAWSSRRAKKSQVEKREQRLPAGPVPCTSSASCGEPVAGPPATRCSAQATLMSPREWEAVAVTSVLMPGSRALRSGLAGAWPQAPVSG